MLFPLMCNLPTQQSVVLSKCGLMLFLPALMFMCHSSWIAVGFCKFPFQIIWDPMRQNAMRTELLMDMLAATNYVDFVED